MKELLSQKLANPSQTPYSKGGEIFMEGKPDMAPQNSQPTNPEHSEKAFQAPKLGMEKPVSAERQAAARKAWEEFDKTFNIGRVLSVDERRVREEIIKRGLPPIAGGTTDVPPGGGEPPAPPVGGPAEQPPTSEESGATEEEETSGSIFEGIPEPALRAEDILRMTPEEITAAQSKINTLRAQIEAFKRAEATRLLNPQEAYDNLNNAIARGEIDIISAQPYLAALGTGAIGFQRQRVPLDMLAAQDIERETEDGTWQRTERLKEIIRTVDPDRQLDESLIRLIAHNREASEVFLDKIISKPFASEGSDYSLSFFAAINLQSFLTEVRQTSEEGPKRYADYVQLHETALRFHQMNKTLITASGNVDAFIEMTRSVNPDHLDTATRIDGVEEVRQLLEMAYGRTYSETDIVDSENFKPKIIAWAENNFRKRAEQGRIKSSFEDEQGNLRNLEEWEITRALSFGRYIHSSFYRHSELISWHHVPEAAVSWLRSFPTETVVRILTGFKWLSQRFKVGEGRGGPELAYLIQQKLEAEYKSKINKLGKLDIRKDILPVGLYRGGGFDKGWRTLWSYLSASPMRLDITDDILQRFPKELMGDAKAFIDAKRQEGKPVLLGEFLAAQGFTAQKFFAQEIKVKGFELPERYSPWDKNKQNKMMEGLLLPLLGWHSKDPVKTAKESYVFNKDDFVYNQEEDQINLALGVMINGPVELTDTVKTLLWEKVAEFLPLRIAYFLSEEGVKPRPNPEKPGEVIKGLDHYEDFKGEKGNLFSDEFESKLIVAQSLRMQEQKKNPKRSIKLEDDFLTNAGMNEAEMQFVRELQKLGKDNAGELAKISFPHIPFLEDVPFQEANYIPLGSEVFPRRMGNDLRGYKEASDALNVILDNTGQKYEQVFEAMHKIVSAISSPEGMPSAQEVGLPIFESYLQMGEQDGWSKFPFVKSALNALNIPVSEFQKIFGANANVYDESDLSLLIREAAKTGLVRFRKLPHEDMSQMRKLLKSLGAEPQNVFFREARNAILLYLMFAAFAFATKTATEKTTA